ncbi:hypothetical protein [Thalassovita sp.]|uniref:hypothetical protein n=1 Tax=Thalassovita sp. TaxID=1979401 RepID=UPI0028826B0F|nr:hypothetical protein [Thalassovita sp.]MDF1801939.1 hypothetical protein [Thalassovita sp.]
MKPILIALGFVALAGCLPPETAPQPTQVPTQKSACVAQGGTYGRGGLSRREICIMPTPDGGQSCSTSTQCSGTCLAQTRSCSKVTPMFGCYSILDSTGKEVSLCVD